MNDRRRKRLAVIYTLLVISLLFDETEAFLINVKDTNKSTEWTTTMTNGITDMSQIQTTLDYEGKIISLNSMIQDVLDFVVDDSVVSRDSVNQSNLIEDDRFVLDICSSFSSCAYQSGVPEHARYCHCDDTCLQFNDCCHDANITDTKPNIKTFECKSAKTINKEFYGYYIVAQCPAESTNSSMCRSTNISDTGPWVIGTDNVVYKNRFCAECHGIFSFKSFAIKIFISHDAGTLDWVSNTNQNNVLSQLMKNEYLSIEMLLPEDVLPRRCLLYAKPAEGFEDTCYKNAVSASVSGTKFKFYVLRNVLCEPAALFYRCFNPLTDTENPFSQFHDVYPLSVLFSFGNDDDCKERTCISRFEGSNLPITETFLFSSNQPFTEEEGHIVAALVAFSISKFIRIDKIVEMSFFANVAEPHYNYVLKLTMNGEIFIKMDISTLYDVNQRLSNMSWSITFQQDGTGPRYIESITEYVELTEGEQEWNVFFIKFDLDYAMSGKIVPKLGKSMIQSYHCIRQAIQCFAYATKLGLSIVIESISCLKSIGDPLDRSVINEVMVILTYTGLSLSVVALGVSIFIYLYTNMYQSVPGCIALCLFITMLVSNILFMGGIGATDNLTLCYIIGVGLHYLWLLVFAFKSIALVHMCNTISKMMTNNGHVVGTRTHLKLILLGLGIPLLFVIPSIVIDILKVPYFRIDYNNRVCFPTGFPGNIIFVTTPIGISVGINTICLVIVTCVLKRQSMETRQVRKSHSYQFVPVFTRIGIVTGMFWIFGIVGNVFDNDIARFIFITFCSFQGSLLSIAFMTTSRVSQKLRERSKGSIDTS